MSGSTIGGVVGGIVGAFFGQPQLGYAIGSLIGGAIDPDKIYGPRIQDGTAQTSQVGIPIAYGWGTFPCAGNIIFTSDVREVRRKESGKGGPVQYTYHPYRTFAIGICRAKKLDSGLYDPIAGILKVKRNGKVVYNVLPDATPEEQAGNAKFLATHEFFLGGESQMPSSVIESFEGAGQVSAYRHLVYMVADDVDLSDTQGAIPQYEFVVVMEGDSSGSVYPGSIRPPQQGRFVDSHFPIDSGAGIVYSYSSFSSTSLQAVIDYASAETGRPLNHYIAYSAYGDGNATDLHGPQWITETPESGETLTLLYGSYPAKGPMYAGEIDCEMPRDTTGADYYLDPSFNMKRRITPPARPDESYFNNCVIEEPFSVVVGFLAISITATKAKYCPLPDGEPVPDAPGWYVSPTGEFFPATPATYDDAGSTYLGLAYDAGTDTITEPILRGDSPDNNEAFWTAAAASAGISGTYGVDYPVNVTGVCVTPETPLPGILRDKVLLSTIVGDLFKSENLASDEFDVSQLTDLVDGFKVATQTGVDAILSPLMQAYFFDVGEWDDKIHCVKRGGNVSEVIPYSALAARDGPAIDETEAQEIELLRAINILSIDPAAGFTTTKQSWSRRTNIVKATGEQTFEVPVVIDVDTAARIAHKKGKVGWSEVRKYAWNVPANHWPQLTATDVVAIEDSKGLYHRVRLMQLGEERGTLEITEAVLDRQSSYTSNVEGVVYPPPNPPPTSILGPTLLVPLNISPLRDQDDQLGIYLAAAGYLQGWPGAEVQLSTDNGETYQPIAQMLSPASIGYTLTALAAEDPDYPSVQTLDIFIRDQPESIDYASFLRYQNRLAIARSDGTAEIIQFQTVTQIGTNQYRLSQIARGRYNTDATSHMAEAYVVVLDQSVLFVQAQQAMLGSSVKLRPVTYGTSVDEAPVLDFTFSPAYSQTEWPVFYVQAERESGEVYTTWIGRPRLGTSLIPHHSQYFDDYRVTYSADGLSFSYDVDGRSKPARYSHLYTVAEQTADFGTPPAELTVTVSAVNTITGPGPESTGILV